MPDAYFSAAQRMEDRFKRTYPWRSCDEATRKRFLAWQGKRLNSLSKSPAFSDYEMGLRNSLNAEKTELEAEKLLASWEAFLEDEAARESNAAVTQAKAAYVPAPAPARPELTPQDHLARLKAMWAFPKQEQFVRDRIAQHPEWQIVIGENGPEIKSNG